MYRYLAILMMTFHIYYISDGTGITAEGFGKTLLSQFKSINCQEFTRRYINTTSKAEALSQEIKGSNQSHTVSDTILFYTLIDPKLRKILEQCECHFFDLS